jgi:hypothetical protein
MRTLVDAELDLDREAMSAERGDIIDDKDVSLWRHKNRIAVAKGTATHMVAEDGTIGYDVPLTCVVHSHPRCRFEWSRVIIDLSPTPNARITDMVPRQVIDGPPVEYTTTVGLGLKFNVIANVLGADATAQRTQKSTVYYPQIVASGAGFTRGYWDFLALGERYLHADRELRLLIAVPEAVPVYSRLQLRARVKFAGPLGVVPFLARGGGIDDVHRLDD